MDVLKDVLQQASAVPTVPRAVAVPAALSALFVRAEVPAAAPRCAPAPPTAPAAASESLPPPAPPIHEAVPRFSRIDPPRFPSIPSIGPIGLRLGVPRFPRFLFLRAPTTSKCAHLNTSRIRSNSCSVCRMVSVNRGKSAGSSVGQFACIRSMLARLLFQRAFSRSVRAFHYS